VQFPAGATVQHSGGQLSPQKDLPADPDTLPPESANAAPVPISVSTPNKIIRFFIVLNIDIT
jgi:hypothetical protein